MTRLPPVATFFYPHEQRSKGRVQELLVSGKGSVRDKLRLLGVYCLAARPSAAEMAELEELLKKSAASSGVEGAEQEAEKGLGAVGYLRQQVRWFRAEEVGGTENKHIREGCCLRLVLLFRASSTVDMFELKGRSRLPRYQCPCVVCADCRHATTGVLAALANDADDGRVR